MSLIEQHRDVLTQIRAALASLAMPPQLLPYLYRLAMAESSLNPQAKARTTTALGLYQHLASTWTNCWLMYGKRLGLTGPVDRSLRLSINLSTRMTALMILDEQKALGTWDNGSLYLAHFLGRSTAKRFLLSDDEDLEAYMRGVNWSAVVRANPKLRGRDRAGVLAFASAKITQDDDHLRACGFDPATVS